MRQKISIVKQWFAVVGILLVIALVIGFGYRSGLYALNSNLEVAKASGILPVITPSAQNSSTAASISIEYTVSKPMPAGATLTLHYNAGYSGTVTTSNTLVTTFAPASVTPLVTTGNSVQTIITLAQPVSAGTPLTLVLTGLTTPATAGSYAFTINTSTDDYGGNVQYVGDVDASQAQTHSPLSLAFDIRTNDDLSHATTCDLGEAHADTISQCEYRLDVSTNTTGGYSVTMEAEGGLSNGVYSITNAASGPTGSVISSGVEMYGAKIAESQFRPDSGIATLPAYTSAAGTIVSFSNTSSAKVFQSRVFNDVVAGNSSDKPATYTSVVTHKLAVSDSTPAGTYTQRITYKITPTF